MQPNPNYANPSSLNSVSHSKSYDPSAPYRAMMMPPPPPPSNNPYSSQDIPATNIDPKTGVAKRIPRFYYPRYDDDDDPYSTQPNFVDPREINPYVPPHPNGIHPYSQPMPLPVDPYASGQYYPYYSPYIIPMTTNLPPQDQSKADVIAAHQKDADLSRLEVYHFIPKQNTSLSMATAPAPPIVQYHVYPNAPPPPIPSQQPQQQFPSYPYQGYSNPPNAPTYVPDPSQPVLPDIETKARGSQTEPPSTKTRGVSPINFYTAAPPQFSTAAPIYDDEDYPYIHKKSMHTDRHDITTGRINRQFYDSNRSTAIADCRCLDCQRERSKVLNYYPD